MILTRKILLSAMLWFTLIALGLIGWAAFVERSSVAWMRTNRPILISAGVLLTLVLAILGLRVIIARYLKPIGKLTDTARAISSGELNRRAELDSQDEIGELAAAFNSMTAQLHGLIGTLEQRVTERTRELERKTVQIQTAAEVAREAAHLRQLDDLLDTVAHLVRERFGFYHTGIFLIDEEHSWAVLRGAAGEAGERMLAEGHKLQLGTQGIVGAVAASGKPRVALDVGLDAAHFKNPHLPDTRSEMALPLRIGDEVIGVLDVQSTQTAAFTQEDVDILQILADQLAIAIANAQLFAENQASLEAARRAYGELSREGWQSYLSQHRIRLESDTHGSRLLTEEDGSSNRLPAVTAPEALPIEVRGQVIGYLEARKAEGDPSWNEDERILLEILTAQLGAALDSARLYESTQQRAERERLVSQITARLRASNDPATILRSAEEDLARALQLKEARIVQRPAPAGNGEELYDTSSPPTGPEKA